ncbi:MAG TPA: magnesium transporter [Patescibacteria group bacterium]|jgi:magnesium transporter|nr:magnesium transporter [Patescibacteria group bacterium]
MNDVTAVILPEIQEILEKDDREALRRALAQVHPADIADVIANLAQAQAAIVFESLTEKKRVLTFEHLEEQDQLRLLEALGRGKMIHIIEEMSADDRADFIQSVPERTAESILPLLAQAERNEVRKLVAYKEDTAGALMTTEYASLPADISVGDALQRLRRIAPDSETIYYVYITDADRKLLGYTTLRELVLARPDQGIMEVRRQPLISASVDTDQEEVARQIQKYDFLALPIVDAENRLVGIVTHDDVIDVLEEEATEDVQRMGGVQPFDTPYLRAGFWHLAWRRGGWLTLLFIEEMATGTALRHYQATLERVVTLMFFVPLIISAGGNSGSQSATLVIRGLAVGDVRLRDWLRVFYRETGMGLALGLFLGTIGYFRALMWGNGSAVGLAVGLSLVLIVMAGSVVGAMLPLLFKILRLDPGVASSPFVASLVDVVGIVVYFNIARMLIPLPGP